jgi:hypothetical protein
VSNVWYYADGNGKVGPFTHQELKETLATFTNASDVFVWRAGFPDWKHARDVVEFDAKGQDISKPAQPEEDAYCATSVQPVFLSEPYPATARMIDIGAFLVLGAGLFMPLARVAFRTVQLIDTNDALLFAGAALAGLLAAVASYRWIAVISALVYGGAFAFFIANYYQRIGDLKEKLKGNPFSGLAESMIGLEWGCAAITLGVLAVLCSTVIVRLGYKS